MRRKEDGEGEVRKENHTEAGQECFGMGYLSIKNLHKEEKGILWRKEGSKRKERSGLRKGERKGVLG